MDTSVIDVPIHTVYPNDPGYPQLLLPLDDRPAKLFFRGSGVQPNDKCIAVVGTRRMTAYGKSATKSFVRDLVLAGFTIVSGLAAGVDGEAHQTALDFEGKTIAIMPSGLDVITPIEHTNLAASIIKAGSTLYSEYNPHQQAAKFHFHVRNRIIAGISMGVLVIEAGERSGTAITVGHAGRYGRPVFAVPGPWTNPYSEGTKAMVNMGAKLVTNIQDILEELRRGKYDVLVGINLLREGLDLPEVSLVAILDADKEGFLRSDVSLIQTMGRAARNINGKVILYADTFTGSIKEAIRQTNRRRELQIKYNKKHGITPKGIIKSVKDMIYE